MRHGSSGGAPRGARALVVLCGVAAAASVRFLDPAPAFADPQGRLDARLTPDGLTLNEQGYQAWVQHLRRSGLLPIVRRVRK